MKQASNTTTPEVPIHPRSGWPVLIGWFLVLAGVITTMALGPVPAKVASLVLIPCDSRVSSSCLGLHRVPLCRGAGGREAIGREKSPEPRTSVATA